MLRKNGLIAALLLIHSGQNSTHFGNTLVLVERLVRLGPDRAHLLEELLLRLVVFGVDHFRNTGDKTLMLVQTEVDLVKQILLLLTATSETTFPFVITHWQGTLRLYATSITPVFRGSDPSPLKRWPSGYTTTPLFGLPWESGREPYLTLHFFAKNSVNH